MRYNNFIQKVTKRGGGGANFIVCARSQNILATSREGKGYGGGGPGWRCTVQLFRASITILAVHPVLD